MSKGVDWKEEYKKCKESPAYLYNNFLLVNGEKPEKQVTDEEFKELEKQADGFIKRRSYK